MRKPPQAQSPAQKKLKTNFSVRIAPDVRAALNKAAECEDRSAGNVALRYIVEGLKAGGYLK
jgi:predicted HicB family RNase H-like nuclease